MTRAEYFTVGIVFLLVIIAFHSTAFAATYTVINTNDSGNGSLRWAIEQANISPGMDRIEFDIPGSGPHTIQPDSPLPAIDNPVTIDGYTQPGAQPNTNPAGQGLNTVLKIELDGTNIDTIHVAGLRIRAGNSTVRGLVINRFSRQGNAFALSGNGGNVIEGCFIGTDVTGTVDLGNYHGLIIYTSDNIIGGTTPESWNLISGNNLSGFCISLSDATGNVVRGNLIGTDVSGAASLGNEIALYTVYEASNNTIGGTEPGAGNFIAFNGGGVEIWAGTGNAILSNSIFSNRAPGIDLDDNGVTPNDLGDGDGGPNNKQNFPVLTSATTFAVQGTLNSTPNTEFRLEFFSNSQCHWTGYGEGETFLGWTTVTTDGSGDDTFTFPFPTPVPEWQFITATATDPGGNTSEFSECQQIPGCLIIVTSPNGGEKWWAGEIENITWTSQMTSGTVAIEYSTNGGGDWQTVIPSTPDDGLYPWTIPGDIAWTPAESSLVRVCDEENGECCGESDSIFTISVPSDLALTQIVCYPPLSVEVSTPVEITMANLGPLDVVKIFAHFMILDENMTPLAEYTEQTGPFAIGGGDSLVVGQEFTPTEAGTFYIRAFLQSECDTNALNDSLTAGPVYVEQQWKAVLYQFIPFSPVWKVYSPESGGGPMVRWSVPWEFLFGATLERIWVAVETDCTLTTSSPFRLGVAPYAQDASLNSSSFRVYIYGPGPNDSTFGDELIPPFEFFPDTVDSAGRIEIDLTDAALVSPEDFDNLVGLTGDFWVHLRATEETREYFFTRDLLPDTSFHRNWYFKVEEPTRGYGRGRDESCPPPGMTRTDKGWEELVGLDFSPPVCEGGERGDVDGSGWPPNVMDVLAVVNHILGKVPITDPDARCRADCTADNEVNILDALSIVNVILGIGECGP